MLRKSVIGAAVLSIVLPLCTGITVALGAQPDPVVLYRKDIPYRSVYAWERWGNFINAQPGDGKEIPYDAAKLAVRVYAFPSGEIRVIDFRSGVRTHPHINMTDTILYTWTGRRVQFGNGQAEQNRPGDAAFHPRGVFHHGEALETGKGIEFATYVDKVAPDPQVTWITAEARPMRAVGPGVAERRFDFGTYVTREIHLSKGAKLTLDTVANQLLFVLSGRILVSAGGSAGSQNFEVAAEDAAHARAGAPFNIVALEAAQVLTSSVPVGTPPPPAFREVR